MLMSRTAGNCAWIGGAGEMRKARRVLGLPVISLSEAAKLGVVGDVVIDPKRRSVVALVVDDAAGRPSTRMLPFESIRGLGPDAVIVESESSATETRDLPGLHTLIDGPVRMVGLQVLTEDGRLVGLVSDVVMDEASGSIESYEISGGLLRDLLRGRSYLRAGEPRRVGQRLMIVPEPPPEELLRSSVPSQEMVPQPRPFEMGVPEREIEEVAAELVAQQSDLVVGMRAGKTIANEDAGGIIVFEGEPITEETVDMAKDAGKLNLLIEAAGEPAMAALSRGLAGRYARVAVGRMAGRTVRTTEGEVIVSQGDVVTPEEVDRAREAGVLDQLVDAVRATEPEA